MGVPERVFSTALLVVTVGCGLIIQYCGTDTMGRIPTWSDCDGEEACLGTAAMLRVCTCLFIFFVLLAAYARIRAVFDYGYEKGSSLLAADADESALKASSNSSDDATNLTLKGAASRISMFTTLITSLWFAPNAVFDDRGFVWALRVAAFVFVLLQQIILIDGAYMWNETVVSWADASYDNFVGSRWLLSLVISSFLLVVGAIVCTAFLFVYFGPPGCQENQAAVSLALVLPLLSTVLQLTGDTGSLLTSAVVWCYATFLCYSAVSSWPEEDCNPTFAMDHDPVSIVLGIGFILLSLAWTVGMASSSMAQILELGGGGESPHLSSMRVNLVLAFAAAYTGMVLTNWGNTSEAEGKEQSGKAVFWMQFVALLLSIFLYSWTLIAPRLFPDRDFS